MPHSCVQAGRLSISIGSAICGLLLATAPTFAQFADPRFWCTDGTVSAMVLHGDTLYIGGRFHTVGLPSGGFIVIDAVTGLQLPNWPKVAGPVSAAAADGRGGWYIGGSFVSVSGVTRSCAAHIRADGTLDGWNPNANGTVNSITVSGARVYLGGAFSTVGGQPRAYLAAVDAATGALESWNPGSTGPVYTIECSHSTVYLQGTFYTVGGLPRYDLAAADSATGSVTAWDAHWLQDDHIGCMLVGGSTVYVGSQRGLTGLDGETGAMLPSVPPVEGKVTALSLSGSTLYLGGNFTAVGGLPRQRLAAVDVVTGVPTAWNPGASSWVWSLSVSGSNVFAGGIFSSIGGVPRAGIAALSVSTGAVKPWNPAATDPIGPLLGVSGTLVGADGVFGPAPSKPRENLAAIKVTTGEVLDWNPGTSGLAPGVGCMALGDSVLYVGGFFDTVGGLSRPEVAAVDLATGAATGWRPFPSSAVTALAVRGPTVYMGGAFTSIGGTTRRYIAAVDATTGVATDWDPEADNMVRAFAIRDSTIYCAGTFTVLAGRPRQRIGALNLNTGAATKWNPGCDQEILTIALGDSALYTGGVFRNIGGQARPYVAALDLAAGAATPWNPSLGGYQVNGLAVSGSTVYVGGRFTSVNGLPRGYAAALDATSGSVRAWNPGANNEVNAFLVAGETVYMGGDFSVVSGQPRQGIARIWPAETTAPSASVLEPGGGEVLAIGTTHRLTWSATDDFAVQSVDLYLSRTAPTGPWELIVAGAPNTGSYDWAVTGPEAIRSAWLLVVARDFAGNLGSDLSNGAFTIAANPLSVNPEPILALALRPPSPNPAHGAAMLTYLVPRAMRLRLSMMDIQGREVSELADGWCEPGVRRASLDVRSLAPGLYFATLQAEGVRLGQRVVVLR